MPEKQSTVCMIHIDCIQLLHRSDRKRHIHTKSLSHITLAHGEECGCNADLGFYLCDCQYVCVCLFGRETQQLLLRLT